MPATPHKTYSLHMLLITLPEHHSQQARAHTLLVVSARLTLEPVRLASAAAPKLLSWLAPLTTDDRDRGVFAAALTALAMVAACAAAPATATPWAAAPATEAACDGDISAFHASKYS